MSSSPPLLEEGDFVQIDSAFGSVASMSRSDSPTNDTGTGSSLATARPVPALDDDDDVRRAFPCRVAPPLTA